MVEVQVGSEVLGSEVLGSSLPECSRFIFGSFIHLVIQM